MLHSIKVKQQSHSEQLQFILEGMNNSSSTEEHILAIVEPFRTLSDVLAFEEELDGSSVKQGQLVGQYNCHFQLVPSEVIKYNLYFASAEVHEIRWRKLCARENTSNRVKATGSLCCQGVQLVWCQGQEEVLRLENLEVVVQ